MGDWLNQVIAFSETLIGNLIIWVIAFTPIIIAVVIKEIKLKKSSESVEPARNSENDIPVNNTFSWGDDIQLLDCGYDLQNDSNRLKERRDSLLSSRQVFPKWEVSFP